MRVGGAMVSERHANFIVNTGQARAKDILTLMDMAKEKVQRFFSVELQPEVCIIGEEEEKSDG
jgi:UDP-N-acetylmuramate dehydrogenase